MVIQSKLQGGGVTPGNQELMFLFWQSDLEHFSPHPGPGGCFVYNNNNNNNRKQASTRMLESVCTTFWPRNCWYDGASNVCFFVFFCLFFFYIFVPSTFLNSSSTFKYIVGLSLKIEILLCILCTVSFKLCTAITVHRVRWSAGKVGGCLRGEEIAAQLEEKGLQMASVHDGAS